MASGVKKQYFDEASLSYKSGVQGLSLHDVSLYAVGVASRLTLHIDRDILVLALIKMARQQNQLTGKFLSVSMLTLATYTNGNTSNMSILRFCCVK